MGRHLVCRASNRVAEEYSSHSIRMRIGLPSLGGSYTTYLDGSASLAYRNRFRLHLKVIPPWRLSHNHTLLISLTTFCGH